MASLIRYAVLDASWSPDGDRLAAANLNAELLLCGVAECPALARAPAQQFWASDTHRLVHDAHHNALDLEVNLQPHLVPRGPLSDADLVAHLPAFQVAPSTDPLEVPGLAAENAAFAALAAQEARREAAEAAEAARCGGHLERPGRTRADEKRALERPGQRGSSSSTHAPAPRRVHELSEFRQLAGYSGGSSSTHALPSPPMQLAGAGGSRHPQQQQRRQRQRQRLAAQPLGVLSAYQPQDVIQAINEMEMSESEAGADSVDSEWKGGGSASSDDEDDEGAEAYVDEDELCSSSDDGVRGGRRERRVSARSQRAAARRARGGRGRRLGGGRAARASEDEDDEDDEDDDKEGGVSGGPSQGGRAARAARRAAARAGRIRKQKARAQSRRRRRGGSGAGTSRASRAARRRADDSEEAEEEEGEEEEEEDYDSSAFVDDDEEEERPRRRRGRGSKGQRATYDEEEDEEDEEDEEEVAGVAQDPIAWLMRTAPCPQELVPQLGDHVVYLRRGHERTLAALPGMRDACGRSPPPYEQYPELPLAVCCEVVGVATVVLPPAATAADAPPATALVQLHVTLRHRLHALETAACETAAYETWRVAVPPPAAGCADFLVLKAQYEHAQRQWQRCRESAAQGRALGVRSAFLVDGAFEWFDGTVVGVVDTPDDLWGSLRVSFAREAAVADRAAVLLHRATDTESLPPGGEEKEESEEGKKGEEEEEEGKEGEEEEEEVESLSPWEVEVSGLEPFVPPCIRLAFGAEELTALAATEEGAILSSAGAASAPSGGATFEGIVARLSSGFYRQHAALAHDVSQLLARHEDGATGCRELAHQMRPAVLQAAAEDPGARSRWRVLYSEAKASEGFGIALATALVAAQRAPDGAMVPVPVASSTGSTKGGGASTATVAAAARAPDTAPDGRAEPSSRRRGHVVHDEDEDDDEEEGEGKVRGLVGDGGKGELVAREAQGTSSDQRPRRGARDGANSAPSSLSSSGMVLRISIPPEHRPMWAARWSERKEASESDERDEGASMRRAVKRARPR